MAVWEEVYLMLEQKTIQAINKLIQSAAEAAENHPIDPNEIRTIAELVSSINVQPDAANDTVAIGFIAQSGGDDE